MVAHLAWVAGADESSLCPTASLRMLIGQVEVCVMTHRSTITVDPSCQMHKLIWPLRVTSHSSISTAPHSRTDTPYLPLSLRQQRVNDRAEPESLAATPDCALCTMLHATASIRPFPFAPTPKRPLSEAMQLSSRIFEPKPLATAPTFALPLIRQECARTRPLSIAVMPLAPLSQPLSRYSVDKRDRL